MSEPTLFHEGKSMSHGGYGEYLATDVIRHMYMGTDPDAADQGYAEVLEFPSPPKGKPKVVFHYFSTLTGHALFAFDTVAQAMRFKFDYQVSRLVAGERPTANYGHLMQKMERLGMRLPWFFCPRIKLIRIPNGMMQKEFSMLWLGTEIPTRGLTRGGYRVPCRAAKLAATDGKPEALAFWERKYSSMSDVDLIFNKEACREV